MIRFNILEIILEKFSKINKKDIIAYISVAFLSFLSFGQFAIDITYNNDGIGRFFRHSRSAFELDSYLYGFTVGRWAYPFFESLYNGLIYLPFFVTIISICLFTVTSIIIWRLFKIESLSQRIITGGLMCSSPIFVHYFFYSGDGEVYATGILLITYGYYLFTSKEKFKNIIGVIITTIALGCYPALFGYCMGLMCLYIIHLFLTNENLPSIFKKSAKLFLFSFISLLFYYSITKIGLGLFDLKMTTYKNADTISPINIVSDIPSKFALTYTLFYDFWTKANVAIKLYLIVISSSLVYITIKKSSKHLPLFIFILAITIPLIYIMFLLTHENQPYEGFIFCLIPLLALLHVPLVRNKSVWIKNTILIFPLLLLFVNLKTTNQIIMKYRLNCESSRILTLNLANDIQKHSSFTPSKKIALIGSLRENDNFNQSSYVPRTSALNGTEVPIAFNSFNTGRYIKNQLELQGLLLQVTDDNETQKIFSALKKMNLPEYPKDGSIFSYNDIVVVNLGY